MTSHARAAWLRTLTTLAVLLGASLLVGFAIGQPWMLLALTAIAILGWHYWRLRRLLTRLTGRRHVLDPERSGVWNELDRLLATSRDDSRASKRRLIAMLRAYRAAAAVLPDAIVVVDRNSQRALWFNEASERLLGLTWPQDIGAPLGPRLNWLSQPHWLAAGRHAEPLLDESPPGNPSLRLNLRLIPYSEELWLLVARDVGKLMHLEQVRRDFVANVSHELRTPLTVLHGYLDMIDPEDKPEWEAIITEMRRQSGRMTRLLEDLLALSRLDARERTPEEHVPMRSMLTALKREAEAMSQGRHRIEIDDRADCDLWGSAKELHSAFSNLVSNAVRYTPSEGRIVITFEPHVDGVALRVTDSGYGIPAEHLPRITERFYRVSASRSRDSGGTGLGLAIVKNALALHGGHLEIESEVGRGSTFSCILPAACMRTRRQNAPLPEALA
ncbi:phosphate regulon sensor histidine kinase PhoR [Luteimonas sp. e5]